MVDAIQAVQALRAGFQAEDRDYAEAQKAAYRVGGRQPDDERTSDAAAKP